MVVRSVPISRIEPAPYNPRKNLRPEDPSYQRLLRSMDEFGCVEPLIWNKKTSHLVGGHQRFQILVAKGATEVEVSVVDLPLKKEKALNLALNRISGAWDEKKLAEVLDEITKTPEIDLEVTGFDLPDVEQLLEKLHAPDPPGDDSLDVDRELAHTSAPTTKLGDLIALGPHRLFCGDATDPKSYAMLLQGELAEMLFADAPYNVAYDAAARPNPKRATPKSWSAIQSDDLSPRRYAEWFLRFAQACTPHLAPGGAFYFWHGHANFGLLHEVLREVDLHPSCVITWAKETFSPGFADYNQQTEFCLHGWKRGARHRFFGPKNETTLWSLPRDPTRTYQHPTQKALPLAERAIRNSSKTAEVVLDPFLGSGTTLIAAARKGRRCFGIEIEPKYCDVVVRRFAALVGEKGIDPKLAKRYRINEVARR